MGYTKRLKGRGLGGGGGVQDIERWRPTRHIYPQIQASPIIRPATVRLNAVSVQSETIKSDAS